jgi:hypothetical protein
MDFPLISFEGYDVNESASTRAFDFFSTFLKKLEEK